MRKSHNDEDALVLMSGGQDSATCLLWGKKNFKKLEAVSFFYEQRHAREINYAKKICKKFDIRIKIIDLSFLQDIVVSSLFAGGGDLSSNHTSCKSVPSSFVPYRNLIFLTVASAWAGTIGIRHLITGVCETDYSGYADCRDVFIKSAQTALNLSTDFKNKNIVIHTPLMWLTKAEEFRMAEEFGYLDFILNETLTCYRGDEKINDFGMGCGKCPSCLLRKKGYDEYREKYGK